MIWYLVVLFAGSVQITPMPSKLACEDMKAVIQQSYSRGSALVDVRCTTINDNGGKK